MQRENSEELVKVARPRLKRALAWKVCLQALTEEGGAQAMGTRESNGARQQRACLITVNRPGHLQIAAHLLYKEAGMASQSAGFVRRTAALRRHADVGIAVPAFRLTSHEAMTMEEYPWRSIKLYCQCLTDRRSC